MSGFGRPRLRRTLCLGAALTLLFGAGLTDLELLGARTLSRTAAQDRSTIIRVLTTSRDWRARVRACLALGSSNDPAATQPLINALRDRNAAVRAAAASSLGRVGDPAALPPLRRAGNDRERAVRNEARSAIRRIEAGNRSTVPEAASHRRATASPEGQTGRYPVISMVPQASDIYWPRIRYVVLLGEMADNSNFRHANLQSALSQEVSRNLLVLRGVAVMPAGQVTPDAERQIRRRRLPKLRLQATVNRIERQNRRREVSVRCEVSIMLLEEPGHAIRSVLNGAATGSQTTRNRRQRAQVERTLAVQALNGAVRSAMSGAARAIASSGR